MTRFKKLCLAVVLTGSPIAAAAETWVQSQTENMHRFQGSFVQRDYGFRVAVPAGIAAYVTNGGDANHFVLMILGDHRTISVDPEYNVADPPAVPCDASQLSFKAPAVTHRQMMTLDGLPACLVAVMEGGVTWDVAQVSRTDRGTAILITIELQSTPAAHEMDRRVFMAVLRSFREARIAP